MPSLMIQFKFPLWLLVHTFIGSYNTATNFQLRLSPVSVIPANEAGGLRPLQVCNRGRIEPFRCIYYFLLLPVFDCACKLSFWPIGYTRSSARCYKPLRCSPLKWSLKHTISLCLTSFGHAWCGSKLPAKIAINTYQNDNRLCSRQFGVDLYPSPHYVKIFKIIFRSHR